jgi:hypothetical protein
VLLIVGALVVGLLLFSLISALVPGIDGTLAAAPIVVVVLVIGTVVVLARSVRGARR